MHPIWKKIVSTEFFLEQNSVLPPIILFFNECILKVYPLHVYVIFYVAIFLIDLI